MSERESFMFFANAVLFAVGAVVQGAEMPARAVVMSIVFIAWISLMVWRVVAQPVTVKR